MCNLEKNVATICFIAGLCLACDNASFRSVGGEEPSDSASDSDSEKGELPKNKSEINDPDDIVALCESSAQKTSQIMLNFPERDECAWNENGNGEQRQTFMQARESQIQTIDLPANAVLCSISLQSTSTNIHYDDFIFLTLDKYMVMGSNDYFVKLLPKEGGLYIWDWAKIFGVAWQDIQPYCMSEADQCIVPPHDQPGALDISLNSANVAELALKVLNLQKLDFTLYSTGDNDAQDCFHSDMSLQADLSFVEL
jgi:hypothetical protein